MAHADQLFLGFDPGGKNGFGVAMLDGQNVATTTVGTVAEAMDWAAGQSGASAPIAAGADTLLHWCDGPSGWRPADKWLRQTYPKSAPSVASANSLYGAMAVGGMALAQRLRERWPSILLNETHPKVLIPALGGDRYADAAPEAAMVWFANYAGLDVSSVRGGHQLDALLSAWATQQGLAVGWADLVGDDPALLFPAGRVSYLWPKVKAEDRIVEERDRKPSRRVTVTGERRESRNTTAIGYVNKHDQEVIRKTDLPGNDHAQRVYVIRCKTCGYEYGANGSDIWLRRCPKHDGGAPGLAH
jgi:hypothetical protein